MGKTSEGIRRYRNTRAECASQKEMDRQTLTNYRNEFDRLMGEMSHLKPELRAEAARKLMDEDKLKVLGDYVPEKSVDPEPPVPRRRAGRPPGPRPPGPRARAKSAGPSR